MTYTKDGIMAQIYVAFGQGTGPIRVSQQTCLELYAQYYNRIDDEVLTNWGTKGVQVLERIRAIGRQMATKAAMAGHTVLAPQNVSAAATSVEVESDTEYCGGNPAVPNP